MRRFNMALFEMNTVKDSVKDDRDKYIGGSDLPKVNNPTSAERLIFEKTHEQKDFTSIYTEFGNIAEPIIRAYVSENFYEGENIEPSTTIIEREGKLGYRGNLDGDNTLREEVIEIKTLGENYYGDPSALTKKIEDYRIQVGYYMMLKEYHTAKIFIFKRPMVLLGKPFNNWTVKEMSDRQTEIEEFIAKELAYQISYIDVKTDELFMPQFDKKTDLIDEVQRRIKLIDNAFAKHSDRQGTATDNDDEPLLQEFKELDEMEKNIAQRKKEILEHFMEKYQSNEQFQIGDDNFFYTAEKESTRKSFDSSRFSKDNPELYQQYVKTSVVKYKPSLKVK